ncbi:hypothetical protein EYC84_003797 [Monilinia fructicola]|uniref:Protein YIP n=1 Tax=Monilinia fructicola TaxID=38448 RepID=A0A5M9JYT1_MONFR|nr:hypothetical protein EYC84_003797 [Monilinia fructicola]
MASSSSSNPYQHYNQPAVEEHDLIDPDDATLDDLDDPLTDTTSRTPLTGTIQPPQTSASQNYLTSRIPGEDRRAPTNTLDETVWETLSRDLLAIWSKMREVLYPKYLFGGSMIDSHGLRGAYSQFRANGMQGAREELRGMLGRCEWDERGAARLGSVGAAGLLSGPVAAVELSGARRPDEQGVQRRVCHGVGRGGGRHGADQVAGGNISFAQSVCIIGYTLFPLVIAALLSALGLHPIPRIPIYLVLVGWSMAAGISILGGSGVVKNRVGLAVFPLFVFYLMLGALCFIS